MSISIHIEARPELGDMYQQIQNAMEALGYYPVSRAGLERLDTEPSLAAQINERVASNMAAEIAAVTEASQETESPPALDTRPVGAPADGNKRRNSAEKAEDDEFEALASAKGVPLDKLNKVIGEAGRVIARAELEKLDRAADEAAAEEKAAISTGEERVGPEDGPDGSEDAARQDAADEAAETEAAGGLAPLDQLRHLVGKYQKAHGMAEAAKLFAADGAFGKGMIEMDDDEIAAAIESLTETLGGSGPASKPAEKPAEKPATKADVMEAMLRYADKFDGTRDQTKMVATMADCPKIFEMRFGEGVTKLSQVPEDGYAQAVIDIREAIAKNPFKRDVKGGA